MPQAREAAKMAVAIDPGLASAWSALAAITILYDRKYEAAEEQFRKALELDPAFATAHHWHATLIFLRLRKMGQALDEMREAERLEPLSPAIANDTGFVLYRDRRFDEAAEQARRTIAMHPGFYRSHALLGRIYCAQGKYPDAVRSCLKARELVEDGSFLPFLLGTLGYAHAASGNAAAASQILEELVALEQRCAPTGHERALVATALGDFDGAVHALKTAFALHAGWMVWVHVEPLFEPLRARGLLTDTSFT
jgi:serine/threonine-protein kinase